MKRFPKLLPVLAVFIMIVLTACATEAAPDANTNTGGVDSSDGGQAGNQNSGDAGNSQLVELGFDLGSPELRATDPSTVSLDSGSKPQLVEFFAFW